MRPRLVKVVRDSIPKYLPEDEVGVQYKPIADVAKFKEELKKKLGEELAEYLISGDPRELADLVGVAEAVADHCHGLRGSEFTDLIVAKESTHGGFRDGLGMFVTTLEEAES